VSGFRRAREAVTYEGFIWHVVRAEFVAPDGEAFERDIVRTTGAVAVVPLRFDAEGTPGVVLVRQYRPALERELLEIPAGIRDVPGEPVEDTARRELAEEVGLHAGRLVPLVTVCPSPGMSDSEHHLYLATELEPVPRALHGPEEAHMEVLDVPLTEALAMIERGEIVDSKTVIGLLVTARRLEAERG
jgi:ADP-ribose pyrophosphatase